MASYTRIGSYLSVSELALDPFGRIHRGLTIAGSSFERHCLLRTFSEELISAGIGLKLEEATRNAAFLSGTRGFGGNYHIEGGKQPLVACDYIPGRNLAQMIEKAKLEQIPLGVDHALSVLQGLSQALITLHSKGIYHGILSPNSIWVSFEGAAQILDAPYASVVGSLLPKCPYAAASLARYRPTASSALHLDLFSLGAILYELLTFEKLPAQDQISVALSRATLKAAQEDGPIPTEIVELMRRLLLIGKPFESPGAFNAELESVLYDGDYSPTTFNMAFFMHTLFREENEHDNQSMKADQAADYTPFVSTETGDKRLVQSTNSGTLIKWGAMVGVAIALGLGVLLYAFHLKGIENEKLVQQLHDLQTQFQKNQMDLADLSRQEQSASNKQREIERQISAAHSPEELAAAKRALEENKKKQEEIQKQKEEKRRIQEELNSKTSSISQLVQPSSQPKQPEPAPAQQPQPVVPVPVAPAPVVAPPPSIPLNIPATSASATTSEEIAPSVLNQARASFPNRLAFLPMNLRNKELPVVLKVFVDSQGRPSKVIVVTGIDQLPACNDNARQAAMDSTYTAGSKDGKAISGWCTLTYKFKIPSHL